LLAVSHQITPAQISNIKAEIHTIIALETVAQTRANKKIDKNKKKP